MNNVPRGFDLNLSFDDAAGSRGNGGVRLLLAVENCHLHVMRVLIILRI